MRNLIKRTCNRIILRTNYSHRTTKTTFYPYKFGGIPAQTLPRENTAFFQTVFDRETLEGFKFAYIQVLKALRDKDKDYLKNILQKGLIDKAQLIDTQLVHENDPIQVSVGKSFMAMGGNFERNDQNRKFTSMSQTNNHFELYISPKGMQKGMGSLPMLFGFQIFFKGKPKLVKTSAKSELDRSENHMIQFEIFNKVSLMNLMPLMSSLQKTQSSTDLTPEVTRNVFKQLVGKNYQWKIGDIDQLLNRNFHLQGNSGNMLGF